MSVCSSRTWLLLWCGATEVAGRRRAVLRQQLYWLGAVCLLCLFCERVSLVTSLCYLT